MSAWTRPQRLAQNMYAHSKEQQELFVEGFVRGYQYRSKPLSVAVEAMVERLRLVNKIPVRSIVEVPQDAGLLTGLFFGFVEEHDFDSLPDDMRRVVITLGQKLCALSPVIGAEVTKTVHKILS